MQPHIRTAGEVQHDVPHVRDLALTGRSRKAWAVQAGGVHHRLAEHAGNVVDHHPESVFREDREGGAGIHEPSSRRSKVPIGIGRRALPSDMASRETW